MRELDVTKLVKTVINLRTIIKKKFKNDPYLLTIQHNRKKVLYLDES
jgi:hypothetical protein